MGRRIRELRDLKGWSQERLAEEAEMDRSYIAGIEDEGTKNDNTIADADHELMTAAHVSFGNPAFLYGLACAWLLFDGKDGAR